MLTPLLLLWPLSLALTWLVAQGIAGKPYDRNLEYNVVSLARLVTFDKQIAHFSLPLPTRELLRASDLDTVYYQILGTRGEYLSGEAELPRPPVNEIKLFGEVRIRDIEFRDADLKVAYTWVRLEGSTDSALVQVAETMDKRSVLATEIVKGVMLPQFVILPLAVLLVWLALVQATKPLQRLEERIRARKPDDLSPLDSEAVPLEVVPLVESVNDLLLRLQESIATQKRFLADAAHQLKTPLAGLLMQADLAQRENASAQDLKQSLRQIARSSIRATNTVNQLLSLARAETSAAILTHEICDLAGLTIHVVRDSVPHAMDKAIDLGYEGAEPGSEGVGVSGNPTLLQELVRNLVDNAMKYTPSSKENPAIVTVRVVLDPVSKAPLLQVEDSGPGIALTERELIFQPFYRVLGSDTDGSGLGLSIVMEIARQHGAVVTVQDSKPGQQPPGTCFTVRFAPVCKA